MKYTLHNRLVIVIVVLELVRKRSKDEYDNSNYSDDKRYLQPSKRCNFEVLSNCYNNHNEILIITV